MLSRKVRNGRRKSSQAWDWVDMFLLEGAGQATKVTEATRGRCVNGRGTIHPVTVLLIVIKKHLETIMLR